MADKKITELTAASAAEISDLLAIVTDVGTAPETKKIAVDDLLLSTLAYAASVTTETLSATRSLTDADTAVLLFDPGGASRIVSLPDEADDNHVFIIINTGDADGEILTVKDYALANNLAILGRGEMGMFISNGTTYRRLQWERKSICMHRPGPLATGDTYMRIPVPDEFANSDLPWAIYGVEAFVGTAGTTNSTQIQLNNGSNDILSTKLYIDTGEYASKDAATAAVINNSYRSLSGVRFVDVDIDAVSTTAPYDLTIMLHVARLA